VLRISSFPGRHNACRREQLTAILKSSSADGESLRHTFGREVTMTESLND